MLLFVLLRRVNNLLHRLVLLRVADRFHRGVDIHWLRLEYFLLDLGEELQVFASDHCRLVRLRVKVHRVGFSGALLALEGGGGSIVVVEYLIRALLDDDDALLEIV